MSAPDFSSERIGALAARFSLHPGAAKQLQTLVEVLASDPLAPTTIRDPPKVIDDHVADSLVALELEVVTGASAVVDIGSGAGLPGLALAIALPAAAFALVESVGRKCAFIDRAVARCGVRNARAVPARVEDFGRHHRSEFDLATARAVAPLDVVAEYAAPLLRVGGALVIWRGRRDPEDEAAGRRAGERLGLEIAEIRAVQPYPAARERHLYVMSKVTQTPLGFPRRPGAAGKRPLGSRRGRDDRPQR